MLCSNCNSTRWHFVIVIIITGARLTLLVCGIMKGVELTLAEYQLVAGGIMRISTILKLALLRSLLTCLTGYGFVGVTRHTSCQSSPP